MRFLRNSFDYRTLTNISALRSQLEKRVPYLYLETNTEEKYVFDAPTVPSQLLRKVVARELGFPSEWDWKRHPKIEQMERTVLRLKQEFARTP